jgi:hypothetical protein
MKNATTSIRGESSLLEEKIVIVLSCDNCGKIYKTVTSNF